MNDINLQTSYNSATGSYNVMLNDKMICQIGRRGAKDGKKIGNISTKTEFFTRSFTHNGVAIDAMTGKTISSLLNKITKAIHATMKGE